MSTTLLRVEVRPRAGMVDPRAQHVIAKAAALGFPVSGAALSRVYLLEGDLSEASRRRIVDALLADPVTEQPFAGAAPSGGAQVVEVHPLPGVMDPAAQSVRDAVRDLTGLDIAVATGTRYDLSGIDAAGAAAFARAALANPVVHRITTQPYCPDSLPHGEAHPLTLRTIPLRGLADPALESLSREAHLFLSLAELRAVAAHYETLGRDPTDIELETIAQTWSEHCVHKTLKSRVEYRELGRGAATPAPTSPSAPTARPGAHPRLGVSFEFTPTGGAGPAPAARDDEHDLSPPDAPGPAPAPGALAWASRPGHSLRDDGVVEIDNLLKRTVAAATHELIDAGLDWTLSVFIDNSGVVELDDDHGVCIKVETHNHPSAIEPYGGAATGAGGCIRDVLGTGLGARPVAGTDVFCVAPPDLAPLPPGALPPRRVLTDVVAGVRDYGNRMGIPTVNGAVHFDERYVGNPLVFCGYVGLIPRHLVRGAAQPGDVILAIGGRTGRDGVHGATFSSAELQATHADEFAHAVQIGNAIEEKRVADALLRARDEGPLYHAITDCGAGGFSSAVGEMGRDLGATVHLDRAPLKYAGLSHTEIWISEAQERMVLAVPPEHLARLRALCAEEGVEAADLGTFGTPDRTLDLFYQGTRVGQLSMEFLHEGLPSPTRRAEWTPPAPPPATGPEAPRAIADTLEALLAHPSIASKHWIIRQYDHEVRGNTIVKPLVGPSQRGPSDASILEPVPGSNVGVALACGLQPGVGDPRVGGDPYQMALAGVDECVRNLVCVGADPSRIAILDNFCWPSCDRPANMGALVRACAGCYDAAMAYRTPFVSGKDSLNNQLRYTDASGAARVIEIPYTLLITGLGRVPTLARATSMDAKKPGSTLVLVGSTTQALGGSTLQRLWPGTRLLRDDDAAAAIPAVDLTLGPGAARAVAQMIADGFVRSAHDCSEGGLLVALAEMLIATSGPAEHAELAKPASLLGDLLSRKPSGRRALGAALTLAHDLLDPLQLAFAESPSRYVIEVAPEDLPRVRTIARDFGGISVTPLGSLNESGRLTWPHADLDVRVDALAQAWLGTLDW